MAPLAVLLFVALLPANLSSLALESPDPLTGQASRWEGWAGVVEAQGLPEGARVGLVDTLGAPIAGSQATVVAGRANLSVVSRLPGLLRLAVNGTPTDDSVLLSGSYANSGLMLFGRPGGSVWAEECILSIRNSRGQTIPDASRESIPVVVDGAGARTDSSGCALLPAAAGRVHNDSIAGLSVEPGNLPGNPSGPVFLSVSAGGSATEFFERGNLRAVRLSAAADIRNFTLVVEPGADGSLSLWSRANASGVARIFLVLEGPGTPLFCMALPEGRGQEHRQVRPRGSAPACGWTPLQTLPVEGKVMVPLPGFGDIRMDTTVWRMDNTAPFVLAIGGVTSVLVLFAARKRRPPATRYAPIR